MAPVFTLKVVGNVQNVGKFVKALWCVSSCLLLDDESHSFSGDTASGLIGVQCDESGGKSLCPICQPEIQAHRGAMNNWGQVRMALT